ncbi:PREDICTED: putative sodium-coupled neutral amino acid transporter 11 isoform X1 [Galeopterus variegatus]|uniref:Putative sodium-coupled neutral amino acid transporter 11 n=1 Tax=Galeopterus variegatus TaxID=482537 RepID=A0ABM0RN26_GALVR|nr:PREDICTED: putative sodium-coupled neutral amino acid transporter 11 isoform X1 [Galeopterus variegatus]
MKQAGFPLGILLLFWVSYVTAMISYNIIAGDTLSKVFQRIPGVEPENLFIGRHFIIVLSTVTFTLPLSLYRNIAKLGKISLISTVLTTLILGIVITRIVSLDPNIPKTEDAWVFAKPSAIEAVGVMSFGDLFENYCRSDDLVTVGRFSYGISVILTYPIECFVTREVIANVFFGGNLSSAFHVVVTVVIVTVVTLLSLLVDCLGIVLELSGALCAAPLIFIIPSACYLRLSEEPRTHSDKIMSCLMLPIGAVVMVFGFVMAITNHQDCTHGQEMFYCFPDNLSLTNISDSHFQLTTQLSILNNSIFQ